MDDDTFDNLADWGYLFYMVIAKDLQHQPRGIVKAAGDRFFYTREDAETFHGTMPSSYRPNFIVVRVWAKMLTEDELTDMK